MTNSSPEPAEGSKYHTREYRGDETIERSGQFGVIADTVSAVGASGVIGAGIAAGKSVINTTINAVKDVKIAKINQGGSDSGGGRHSADD